MAQPLLEPVAAGQTRFRMQGLAPDARGIAVGRELLVVVSTLDRLVAFLGAYSEEASLDDLMSTLTLERASRVGGGHAFLLRFAAGDGYTADRAGRLVAAVRGQLYTGSGSIFVRWRERDAPFGYDLVESVDVGPADVVLVDVEFVGRYGVADRIDPVDLVQRLQLQVVPIPLGGVGQAADGAGVREMALVLVAPGLVRRALSYLWRVEHPFAGYPVRIEDDSRDAMLLRVRQPDPRVIDVLRSTPGVEVFVPVSARTAVELGYRHPIELRSASSCFPGEDVFLFRGTVRRVERVAGPPRFVDGRHLVEGSSEVTLQRVGFLGDGEVEKLRVDLKMRPSTVPREPRGVLVPWDRAQLLRKLVYLIPPSALAASRLAMLEQGLVVLTTALVGARNAATVASLGAGSLVPLGRRLCEAAPGVLVPDGWEPWPRVRPELLRDLLELAVDDHAVFLSPDEEPVRLPAAKLRPLDAAVLARIPPSEGEWVEPELSEIGPAELRNERLGRFALWGFGRAETVELNRGLMPAPGEGEAGG